MYCLTVTPMFFFSPVIAQYKPTDATTNPSLLYAAAQLSQYDALVQDAITFAKGASRYVYTSIKIFNFAWHSDLYHLLSMPLHFGIVTFLSMPLHRIRTYKIYIMSHTKSTFEHILH